MPTFPLPTFLSLSVAPLPTAIQAINMLNKSSLANATVDVLTSYTPSPVDLLVNTAEALYADACSANSVTSTDAKVLCFQVADVCVANGFHNIGQTTRGPSICLEMRRQLGDPNLPSSVTEAQRPAVLSQYDLDPVVQAPVANAVAS